MVVARGRSSLVARSRATTPRGYRKGGGRGEHTPQRGGGGDGGGATFASRSSSTASAYTAPAAGGGMAVTLHTNVGDMKLELFCEDAPMASEVFLR